MGRDGEYQGDEPYPKKLNRSVWSSICNSPTDDYWLPSTPLLKGAAVSADNKAAARFLRTTADFRLAPLTEDSIEGLRRCADLMAAAPKVIFVRFGDLPSDGRSKNHLTDELEAGVSVYEAIERDGKISLLLPSMTGSACVSMSGCFFGKPFYEVDGTVVGTGSDGEPVLSPCRIVRTILAEGVNA